MSPRRAMKIAYGEADTTFPRSERIRWRRWRRIIARKEARARRSWQWIHGRHDWATAHAWAQEMRRSPAQLKADLVRAGAELAQFVSVEAAEAIKAGVGVRRL